MSAAGALAPRSTGSIGHISAPEKDVRVTPRADSAALNVQPRQRRHVYEALSNTPDGQSVKDLLGELDMPERDLRESLRKLDDAGLVHRERGQWKAVPLEASAPAPPPDSVETP
jgi:hypothetical protein